jgi:hypothetical protein
VAVDGADVDTRPCGDLAHRGVHARRGERRLGRLESP